MPMAAMKLTKQVLTNRLVRIDADQRRFKMGVRESLVGRGRRSSMRRARDLIGQNLAFAICALSCIGSIPIGAGHGAVV